VTAPLASPEALLSDLGITEPEEIDLEAIAFYCGATVVEGDLRGCEARLVGSGNKAFITVKRDGNPHRRRFSIGHELGHWAHDRGRANFRCGKAEFQTWGGVSPEQRANTYAANLLLPRSMFVPRTKDRPVTLDTASDLANVFRTSLTSTAIRFVEYRGLPAVVAFSTDRGVSWSRRSKDVPFPVKLRGAATSDSVAYDLLRTDAAAPGPTDISADAWFDDYHARWHSVQEDSRRVAGGVLTLLWWPDEGHLLRYV
jgi:hypothetical protein